jgi:hypothetical protein
MRQIPLVLALLAPLGCSDNRTPYGPDAGEGGDVFACLPDLDGVLTREEMPTVLGNPVSFLIANDVQVNLGGEEWQLRGQLPGEIKQELVALPLAGYWFESDFPGDSIVVALDSSRQSFGILQDRDAAISLIGIASSLADHTLLHYQDPIDLYRFPLQVGKSWTASSAVTGTFEAVPYNGSDTYEVSVDGAGIASLPHLRFSAAMRVRTQVTSDSGAAGVVVVRQQTSLVSECFGEIARALSNDDETNRDFTTARELWRFSL